MCQEISCMIYENIWIHYVWYDMLVFLPSKKFLRKLHFSNPIVLKQKNICFQKTQIYVYHPALTQPFFESDMDPAARPTYMVWSLFSSRGSHGCEFRKKPSGEDGVALVNVFSCCQLIPGYLWIYKKAIGEMESFQFLRLVLFIIS